MKQYWIGPIEGQGKTLALARKDAEKRASEALSAGFRLIIPPKGHELRAVTISELDGRRRLVEFYLDGRTFCHVAPLGNSSTLELTVQFIAEYGLNATTTAEEVEDLVDWAAHYYPISAQSLHAKVAFFKKHAELVAKGHSPQMAHRLALGDPSLKGEQSCSK